MTTIERIQKLFRTIQDKYKIEPADISQVLSNYLTRLAASVHSPDNPQNNKILEDLSDPSDLADLLDLADEKAKEELERRNFASSLGWQIAQAIRSVVVAAIMKGV